MADRDKTPIRVAIADVTRLPLTRSDGYVLAQIDGRISVDELPDLVGLPASAVEESLARLVAFGAIEIVESDVRAREGRHAAASREIAIVPSSLPPARGSLPDDPDEEVDLDPTRKRLVLETYLRLGELDHYELLGVVQSAEKAAIKTAYFQLSKLFHPDTAYGKRLGSYKAKMEAVFRRLTEAHDTLSKNRARAEYDAELERRGKRTPLPLAVAPEPSTPPPAARPSAVPATQVSPPAPPSSPPAVTSSLRPPSPTMRAAVAYGSTVRPPTTPGVRTDDAHAPRASTTPPAATSEPPAARPTTSRPPADLLRDLASSLKSASTITGSVDRVDRFLAEARSAERRGDLTTAEKTARLARQLAPERTDVAVEHERMRRALLATSAGDHEAEALAAERAGRWAAASLAWGKVCDGRPDDAAAHRHAAHALIEAKGDLRRARTLAQRAVDLRPDLESYLGLARVYVEAGMKLNAQRELDLAAKLGPADPRLAALTRAMKALP